MAQHQDSPDDLTGQEIEEGMSPDARARAEDELAHVEPGPSEPLRFGDEGARTQLDEDPISEVEPFREGRP
jgi:hypothetical protein